MKDISFTEFKKLKAGDLKELKSFGVTADGELLFICVIPQTGYIESAVEELCILSNAQGGKEIERCLSLDGVLQH